MVSYKTELEDLIDDILSDCNDFLTIDHCLRKIAEFKLFTKYRYEIEQAEAIRKAKQHDIYAYEYDYIYGEK